MTDLKPMDLSNTKIAIIKTGDTLPVIAEQLGDFEDWIFKGLNVDKETIQVVDITKGEILPSAKTLKGVVITGSHAAVTQNLSWSVAIEQWIPGLIQSETPILGICYGHQLLAKAMGGVVEFHTRGSEIGTREIEIKEEGTQDPLFKGLPKIFKAHVCHSQTITRLPDHAVRLAKNHFEPNHAYRIGQSAWGVQFHPEFDGRIMAAYAKNMETPIKESGLVLSRILDKIAPTPIALKILNRFGKRVR
ncbi:glutamine amidotransferase [Desulfobacula sp.]